MFGGAFDRKNAAGTPDEEPAYVPDLGAGAPPSGYAQQGGDVASYLNSGTYFKGLLRSERSIGIDGRFEGEIQSEADIVIGREAEVKANIKANNVIVSGRVSGHISCGTLEIQSTGKVIGNIAAGSLLIAMGAMFRGQSIMGEEDEEMAPAALPPAPVAAATSPTDHQQQPAATPPSSVDVTEPAPMDISEIEPE
ncbi:MAG: polymer-forming cytoskeletal protein [Chloroflexota bacterium]|nr:polymer-forming cytoskeletal protein [Chloroflexota bacterium]